MYCQHKIPNFSPRLWTHVLNERTKIFLEFLSKNPTRVFTASKFLMIYTFRSNDYILGYKLRATLVRLLFSACNYFMAYCFNISPRVAQMGRKTERKTQYWWGFFFEKHCQSGGKNAIKNAKQDSPFQNFFHIRWNVESYDDKREKVIFHATRILTRGMVAKISLLSRLKNFWDYQFSLECSTEEIAGERYFEWKLLFVNRIVWAS